MMSGKPTPKQPNAPKRKGKGAPAKATEKPSHNYKDKVNQEPAYPKLARNQKAPTKEDKRTVISITRSGSGSSNSSWSPMPQGTGNGSGEGGPALLKTLFGSAEVAKGKNVAGKGSSSAAQSNAAKRNAASASAVEAALVENAPAPKIDPNNVAGGKQSQQSSESVNNLFSMASKGELVGASEAKVATGLQAVLEKQQQNDSSSSRKDKANNGAKDAPVASLAAETTVSSISHKVEPYPARSYTIEELTSMRAPVVQAIGEVAKEKYGIDLDQEKDYTIALVEGKFPKFADLKNKGFPGFEGLAELEFELVPHEPYENRDKLKSKQVLEAIPAWRAKEKQKPSNGTHQKYESKQWDIPEKEGGTSNAAPAYDDFLEKKRALEEERQRRSAARATHNVSSGRPDALGEDFFGLDDKGPSELGELQESAEKISEEPVEEKKETDAAEPNKQQGVQSKGEQSAWGQKAYDPFGGGLFFSSNDQGSRSTIDKLSAAFQGGGFNSVLGFGSPWSTPAPQKEAANTPFVDNDASKDADGDHEKNTFPSLSSRPAADGTGAHKTDGHGSHQKELDILSKGAARAWRNSNHPPTDTQPLTGSTPSGSFHDHSAQHVDSGRNKPAYGLLSPPPGLNQNSHVSPPGFNESLLSSIVKDGSAVHKDAGTPAHDGTLVPPAPPGFGDFSNNAPSKSPLKQADVQTKTVGGAKKVAYNAAARRPPTASQTGNHGSPANQRKQGAQSLVPSAVLRKKKT